jgi:hypothetical protein
VTASAQRLAARIEKARSIEECHQIVRDMLSIAKKAKKDRSSRRRDRTTRAPGRTKAQRRASKKEHRSEVRAACVQRSDGECECCGGPGATEMHHLISGGLRSHREKPETCAMLCGFCHREWHRGGIAIIEAVGEWAQRHGYHEAEVECGRRIAKINEARATVPVRLVVGSLRAGGTT